MGTGQSSARPCCGRAMDLVIRSARQRKPPKFWTVSSPDAVVRGRLAKEPKLANPRHKPPDPNVMAEAMRAVESAKEVSRPDS